MSEQRLIIQMAQATDATGDMQRAAVRAVKRALSQADIAAPETLGLTSDAVRVCINLGVPEPAAVDAEALVALNKLGQTDIRITPGGLKVQDSETGAVQIAATAAVEVFLPIQTGWRIKS
ncbi:Lin0512 family protein [Primorskyibacter sp. S187A]|uniref:Lin0512 family protein n=1 Tax=Primorskyibacter sp. S187A TaxID=3415130 RepID=UPI003C7C7C88